MVLHERIRPNIDRSPDYAEGTLVGRDPVALKPPPVGTLGLDTSINHDMAETALQQAAAIVVTKEARHWLRANILRPLALAAVTALIVFLLLSFDVISWSVPG